MNSVERILHYCATIPQENTPCPITPSENWPEHGTLVCGNKRGERRKRLERETRAGGRGEQEGRG